MTSDEALILDFQRGSREAFDELYARYRQPLYGFFRRRLDTDLRAEDLAQESFLAVIRGSARYEPRALFRTYLYGIALNLLAAERRKHRQSTTPVSESDATSESAPDRDLWVRQALKKLDRNDREILMLREYEQLTYTEIAELLRVPLNTVRTRLFRARIKLKSYLQPKELVRRNRAAGTGTAAGDGGPEEGMR
jgi:RNA polymerase sigma-70 factor (ECF subfamily)